MKLIDSKTYQNLAKAFAGECQAMTRYKFVEYGARKEGYEAIAQIIDGIIYQEFNHARMIYTFIETASEDEIKNIDVKAGYPFKQKWNLLDNLKLSSDDERVEGSQVYPEYAKVAEKEGFSDIAGLFNNLSKIELQHEKVFLSMYDQMKDGTLYKKSSEYSWVCPSCGYRHEGKQAPKKCPVCQSKQITFELNLDTACV